jgi:hypothetical protein
MNFRTLTLSTIALAALTACGGGGSDSSAPAGGTSGGSTGGTTTIVDASGTLLTSSSTSTYTVGSMGQEVYDALNAARLASGAGALMQSIALDVAASAHGGYLTSVLNNASLTPAQQAEFASGTLHQEFADLVPSNLFYASTPQDRAVKAGLVSTGVASEGIAGGHKLVNGQFAVDGASCAAGLLGTVYHADTALSPYTLVSVAQFTDGIGEPGCVVDYARPTGYGQVRPAGSVVANPAPNSTVSGTFLINTESPRPAASLIPGATAGTPILVSVYNADYINANGAAAPTVTKFEVRDAGGNLVDAVILGATDIAGTSVNADALLSAGTVVLIPKAPLAAGVYSVSFAGTIKGAAVTKAWSFTAQ